MKIKFLLLLLSIYVQIAHTQDITPSLNEKKITILYTNDLHSHVEPLKVPWISHTRLLGGFANIATLVKKEKATNANTLYLDAGDYFCGPYISSLTNGEAIIDLMNYMNIDATTIGNHEFDYGWENAFTQLQKATFPIINGNIFLKGTETLFWNQPYKIITIDGVRIGIIGLHGKFAFYDTTSEEMVMGIEAKDEVFYLRKYIDELNNKVDLIVLLAHQGIPGRQSSSGSTDVARNLQTDIDLAQKVSGVDIMITGHAHQGTPDSLWYSNGTLIVSTDALGIELGKLEISYNSVSQIKLLPIKIRSITLYDDEVEDDTTVLRVINVWKQKIMSITDEKVCTASSPLTRSYSEESFLGNIVADAMLHAYPEYDFALTNSGGLRQDVDAGLVTVGNLISAFPFPNTVVQLELIGSEIRALFEHGARLTNGVLQVSAGVEMVYDENKDHRLQNDKMYYQRETTGRSKNIPGAHFQFSC
jgi:5'-nucleotidase/UDP-sugar diphosphatase